MLGFSEAKIAAAAGEGPEWMPLFGSSLVGAGCLRYRHVSMLEYPTQDHQELLPCLLLSGQAVAKP